MKGKGYVQRWVAGGGGKWGEKNSDASSFPSAFQRLHGVTGGTPQQHQVNTTTTAEPHSTSNIHLLIRRRTSGGVGKVECGVLIVRLLGHPPV